MSKRKLDVTEKKLHQAILAGNQSVLAYYSSLIIFQLMPISIDIDAETSGRDCPGQCRKSTSFECSSWDSTNYLFVLEIDLILFSGLDTSVARCERVVVV